MRRFLLFVFLALLLPLVIFNRAAVPAVAERLIEISWQRTLAGRENVQPWPGAVSVPVAQLRIPDAGKNFVVLSGESGALSALAPVWHEGSALPGSDGIAVISGARETHFSFLRRMKTGQDVLLTDRAGLSHRYVVEEVAVVQDREIRVNIGENKGILLLTTTYPIANWEDGDQIRLVVIAREKASDLIAAAEPDMSGA